MASTRNSKVIRASVETVYRAFADPEALAAWLAPGNMKGKIHSFDFRPGGGYSMSLFYPESEKEARGKTSAKEDRFTSRFIELIPFRKIVQAVTFDSDDPAFSGKMMIETLFERTGNGTKVTFTFTNLPPGIRPEDNEVGTELSLQKLASYVE